VDGAGRYLRSATRSTRAFELVNAALQQGGTFTGAGCVKTRRERRRARSELRLSKAALDGLSKKYDVSAVVSRRRQTRWPSRRRAWGLPAWAPSMTRMDAGWILENYGFEPKSIYNADIRSANLKSRYDVIVLPDMSSRPAHSRLRSGHCAGAVCGRP